MRTVSILVAGFLIATNDAGAAMVPLSFTDDGDVGGTRVFKAEVSGTGLSEIRSLTITDDGTEVGGSAGIFSGFDLDAIFVDLDGVRSTSGDKVFGSQLFFNAGSTRDTTDSNLLPTIEHPGPVFGSLSATEVDTGTATLDVFDGGSSVANVDTADGFLTLGDGGSLALSFANIIPLDPTNKPAIFVGEVGGQPGEGLGGTVFVSDAVVPLPAAGWLFLTGVGALAALSRRRQPATV